MKLNPYFLTFAATCSALLLLANYKLRTPKNERITLAKAQTLVATSNGDSTKLEEAVTIASDALFRDPLQIHALFVQGWALQRLGKAPEANRSYEIALQQINELSKYINFNVALLYEARGDTELALSHFIKSTNEDSHMTIAWTKAAKLLLALNRKSEAVELLQLAVTENPGDKELLLLLNSSKS